MLGAGAAAFSALLAWQGGTELEAGANLDVRVGQAPTGIPTDTSGTFEMTEQTQLMFSATPLLGARWTSAETELRALSATRMLWRPMPFGDRRPIFLETLEAGHAVQLSQRTRWRLELRSTYGEEDYTSLLRQFGTNQPALPPALSMFTVNAVGDGSWRASRRTTMILLANGTYRRALSDVTQRTETTTVPAVVADERVRALPTETQVVVTPGLRYAVDRRTNFEVRAGIGDTNLEDVQFRRSTAQSSAPGRVNILFFQPEVGLIRDLTRTQQLSVFAGLTYASVLANPDSRVNWRPLTPLFRGELSSLLWRVRASNLRSLLGAETSWYADPVLGLAVWRGTVRANLEAQLGPRWNASARASFTTDLSPPVDTTLTGGFRLDETVVQLDIPIRYRWSSQLAVEFGGRYAERAPNLRATDFAWHYRELWAFVTLTSTTHRTRNAPSVSPAPAPTSKPGPAPRS